jgi:L-asparaginase
MSPDLIDASVANGTKGIVIVRASRVAGGSVGRNVEVDDDKYGFVVSGELSPSKARVLLKLALLNSNDPEEIQALFDKY